MSTVIGQEILVLNQNKKRFWLAADKNNLRIKLTKQEGWDLLGVFGLCISGVSENRLRKTSVRNAHEILRRGEDVD